MIPAVEHSVFGSTVSRAVLANDLEQLKQFAKSKDLYVWPSVVVDLLALVLGRGGEFELADHVFRVARLRFPSDAQVNSSYGYYLSTRFPHIPTKALPYLATAASLDPSPGTVFNFASCLSNAGEYKMAESLLTDLLTKYPDYYFASFILAKCKLSLNDPRGAVQVLEQAIARGCELTDVFVHLAEINMTHGRWNQVDKSLRRLRNPVELPPDQFRAVINLLTQMGRINQAIELGDEYLKRYKNVPFVPMFVAYAYLEKGEYEKAIELYKAERHRTPIPQTMIGIAECLGRQGKFEEALVYYVQGHELSLTNPHLKSSSMHLVRRVENQVRQSQDLTTAIQQIRNHNDPEEITDFIQQTLIPLRRWREAYELAALVLNDPKTRDPGTAFLLNAATCAMETLRAAPAELVAGDPQSDEGLVSQVEQDLLAWLQRAISNGQQEFIQPSRIVRELYPLRLFSEANRFQVLRQRESLAGLSTDTRKQLQSMLTKIEETKQKLEKRFP